MNYFERLIRRALLEAPARAGDALRDPFENVAPLALEAPAPALAPPPATTPSVRSEVAPSTHEIVETRSTVRIEHNAQRAEPAPVPVPSVVPPVPQPAPVPATAPATEVAVTPQAQADAFMRSLGVEAARTAVPPRRAPPGSIAPPAAPAPVNAPAIFAREPTVRDETSEAPRARPAPLQPPAALRRETSIPESKPRESRRSRADAHTPAPSPQAPRQRQREREVVREKIHVVKIVQGTNETAGNAGAGAAPPTFGAAQL